LRWRWHWGRSLVVLIVLPVGWHNRHNIRKDLQDNIRLRHFLLIGVWNLQVCVQATVIVWIAVQLKEYAVFERGD
jgi:hypothetical protein